MSIHDYKRCGHKCCWCGAMPNQNHGRNCLVQQRAYAVPRSTAWALIKVGPPTPHIGRGTNDA